VDKQYVAVVDGRRRCPTVAPGRMATD
jgi:hypothetical protein